MSSVTSIRVLLLVALAALMTACGGGGSGGGGDKDGPAPSSNWDTMVWDQDNWS